MKSILAALTALALFAPCVAHAQADKSPPAQQTTERPSDAAMAAARRLVVSARTEQILLRTYDQLIDMMLNPLADAHGLSSSQRALVRQVLIEEVSADTGPLVQMIALSYAQRLSVEDIIAIAEFNESPAGQRFLDIMPAMQEDLGVAADRWAREVLVPRIEQRFREMQERDFQPT